MQDRFYQNVNWKQNRSLVYVSVTEVEIFVFQVCWYLNVSIWDIIDLNMHYLLLSWPEIPICCCLEQKSFSKRFSIEIFMLKSRLHWKGGKKRSHPDNLNKGCLCEMDWATLWMSFWKLHLIKSCCEQHLIFLLLLEEPYGIGRVSYTVRPSHEIRTNRCTAVIKWKAWDEQPPVLSWKRGRSESTYSFSPFQPWTNPASCRLNHELIGFENVQGKHKGILVFT